jgi:hypothetical protein
MGTFYMISGGLQSDKLTFEIRLNGRREGRRGIANLEKKVVFNTPPHPFLAVGHLPGTKSSD